MPSFSRRWNTIVESCTIIYFFILFQECANVFIETRDKDKEVKYALAGVFVEILVPVAATAKRELQIPALKIFIEMLYPCALEMSKKNKHIPVSVHYAYIIQFYHCSTSTMLLFLYACRYRSLGG